VPDNRQPAPSLAPRPREAAAAAAAAADIASIAHS